MADKKMRGDKVLMDRESFMDAALTVIAERGVAGVKIGPLTKLLGVSRGSFYWHFENRDELIREALGHWETVSTTVVLAKLETRADPREKLRRLFVAGYADQANGELFAALSAATHDPLVSRTLQRISTKRLAFLQGCFKELGFADEAEHRALLAYSAYVGLYDILRAVPRDRANAIRRDLDAYLEHVIAALLPVDA
ncbi:MAG: TetR/AcrR family transcriptional regulator [Sandaracinaceae bacterium]